MLIARVQARLRRKSGRSGAVAKEMEKQNWNALFELTPREEIFSRVNRFQKSMAEKSVHLVLLIQNVDLFYFTGTIQNGFLFIRRKGRPSSLS